MTSRRMGKKFSQLAEECEPLWLLHMETEYISFLVSIESEMRFLRHINSCEVCKNKLASIFSGQRDPFDELEELFAIELPEKLLHSSSMLDCPVKETYIEANKYIEARISWRLDKLQSILSNAELELKHLSGRIREESETTF